MTKIPEGLLPLAVPLDSLDLLPGNPRRGDVDAVARSLDRFGQRKPVVVRVEDDKTFVVAGNHTVMAARQLGWTEIAAAPADDLSDDEAMAYAIADNRTQDLGSYDDELLAQMVDVLAQRDKELLTAAGYDDEALKDLLALVNPPDFDDLLAEVGDPDEDSVFWPEIRVKVEPSVFKRWEKAMDLLGANADTRKIEALLDAFEESNAELMLRNVGDD